MKKALTIILLLISQCAFSQKPDLPWELERYSSNEYAVLESSEFSEMDTYELFIEYFKIYKSRRSIDPSSYYLPPNATQQVIKDEILLKNSYEEINHLINFLESGSPTHLELLSESEPVFAESYPYRFLAALIAKDSENTLRYIRLLDENEMISPVLKSFGLNAIATETSQTYVSQGLQDLIGIYWALEQQKEISQCQVYNEYVNSFLNEYAGVEGFLDQFPEAWISPTIHDSFLEDNLRFLRFSGIGFKRISAQEHLAYVEWNNTKSSFSGIGINPKTPADKGLIQSYFYFNEQLKNLKSADADANELETQLSIYIKETDRLK